MAVPNQNNINDIIKSRVDSLNETISIIIDAVSSKTIIRAAKDIKNLNKYQNIIDSIFGTDGVFATIMSAVQNAEKFSKVSPFRTMKIKKNFRLIEKLIDYVLDLKIYFENVAKEIKNFKKYQNIIDSIFGTDGVFTLIMSAVQNIENFSQIPALKMMIIKKHIRSIKNITNYILKLKIDSKKASSVTNSLKHVLEMYTTISDVLNKVNSLKTPVGIGIKLMFVKIALWKIAKMGFFLNLLNLMVPIMTTGMLSLTILKTYVSMLTDIFGSIENIKVRPMMLIKLKLIQTMLIKILNIIYILNNIYMVIAATGGLKDSIVLAKVFDMIGNVFKAIKAIKMGILFNHKLVRINNALNNIRRIIITLNKIRINPSILIKLILLESMFVAMGTLFLSVVLLTPTVLLAVPALLLLIVGVYALKLVTNMIVKMLENMVKFSVIKGLLFITLILFLYTSLTSMLLIIALMSKPIVNSVLSILGLFGVIILVTAATIGLGMLMSILTPIMLPTIIGLTMIIAVIGVLALVAIALKVIETIKLDRERINENIQLVLETARYIISSIFGTNDKTEKDEKNSWLTDLLSSIGNGLGTIIKSIASIPFLIATLASVTIILFIAIQLRILQMLKLDTAAINNNVSIVLDTASNIIKAIFDRNDEAKESPTRKDSIKNTLGKICTGITNVVGAILSIAWLASTIFAIGVLTLLAGQLRLLQTIDLDTAKITASVELILTTCKDVTNAIFKKDEDSNETPSNKSWLGSVLKHIGGGALSILEAIMSISWLATAIGAMSLVHVLAIQLNKISDLKIDSDINTKVQLVIDSCKTIIDSIFNNKDTQPSNAEGNTEKKGLLSKVISGIGEGINFISKLGWLSTALISIGMVGQLAEHLNTINNLPDLSNIDSKVVAISGASDKIIASFAASDNVVISDRKLNLIERIIKIFSNTSIDPNTAENSGKLLDNYIELVDKINSVEVNKLETATNMFKQMSNFSSNIKGDFDKLAESLSDKLLPVLLELKEIMGVLPEKIEVGFQNTSASIGAASAPATKENVTAQTLRENPNLTKEEVNKIVSTRMNDKALADANGVSAKLDELISLLKGFGGEQVVVRTI